MSLTKIDAEYKHFDADIIMHINGVFSILSQLGVGPDEGFSIQSDAETWDQWDQFVGNNMNTKRFAMVKSYMHLKVRLLFDPPLSAALIESTKTELSTGQKFIEDVLKDVGKKTLTTALTGMALYGTKATITQEFNRKEFGDAIFNGGAKKK